MQSLGRRSTVNTSSGYWAPSFNNGRQKFRVGVWCVVALRRLRASTREVLHAEEQKRLLALYFSFGSKVGMIDSFHKIRDLIFASGEQSVPENVLADFLERVEFVEGSNFALKQFMEVMTLVKRRFLINSKSSDTQCAFLGLLEDDEHDADVSISTLLAVCAQFRLSSEVETLITGADQDGGGRIDFREFEQLLVSRDPAATTLGPPPSLSCSFLAETPRGLEAPVSSQHAPPLLTKEGALVAPIILSPGSHSHCGSSADEGSGCQQMQRSDQCCDSACSVSGEPSFLHLRQQQRQEHCAARRQRESEDAAEKEERAVQLDQRLLATLTRLNETGSLAAFREQQRDRRARQNERLASLATPRITTPKHPSATVATAEVTAITPGLMASADGGAAAIIRPEGVEGAQRGNESGRQQLVRPCRPPSSRPGSARGAASFGSTTPRFGTPLVPLPPPHGSAHVRPLRAHSKDQRLDPSQRRSACGWEAQECFREASHYRKTRTERSHIIAGGNSALKSDGVVQKDVPEYQLFNPFLGVPVQHLRPHGDPRSGLQAAVIKAARRHPAGDIFLPLVADVVKRRVKRRRVAPAQQRMVAEEKVVISLQ